MQNLLIMFWFCLARGSPNIEMDEHTFMVNRERAVDYLNSLDKVIFLNLVTFLNIIVFVITPQNLFIFALVFGQWPQICDPFSFLVMVKWDYGIYIVVFFNIWWPSWSWSFGRRNLVVYWINFLINNFWVFLSGAIYLVLLLSYSNIETR